MPKRKARRTRTQHTGVKLKKRTLPSGAVTWLARWICPDEGRERAQSLDALRLTSAEARRAWAIDKSEEIATRRRARAAGAPARVVKPLGEAVEDYLTACNRLRDSTLAGYREAVDTFAAWCERSGVRLTEEVTPERLAAYREAATAKKHRKLKRGGRPGEREETDRSAHPVTINSHLARVKPFLNYLRRLGLATRLNTDNIRDALRPLRAPKPLPVILRQVELAQLLRAALKHDAEVFDLTREEKARGVKKGETPRYAPVAPFIVTVLLGGFRFAEARALEWSRVYLDAPDERGQPAGEVHVGTESKTHTARIVDLAVTPALRKILGAMRLKAGDAPFVFGGNEPWSRTRLEAARKRLVNDYGAPVFDWQTLRRSCGSYSVCASVYGSAGIFLTARRLGHSTGVCEKHYLNALRGLPRATDLESAMQVGDLLTLLVRRMSGELTPGQLGAAMAERERAGAVR